MKLASVSQLCTRPNMQKNGMSCETKTEIFSVHPISTEFLLTVS